MTQVNRQRLMTKPSALHELLQTQPTVLVHLDPRISGVVIPPQFKTEPFLVLQLGLSTVVPIRDLKIDALKWSGTLSFGRTPFFCVVPWNAVYLIMSPETGIGAAWDADVPPEVLERIQEVLQKPRPAHPPPCPPAHNQPAVSKKLPPGWKVHKGGKKDDPGPSRAG